MKKNYKGIITLSLIAASFTGFSQADVEANTKIFTADEKIEILSQVKTNTIKKVNNKANCNDTITTPLLSGNGFDGVMFDIVIGANDLTIETFWVSIDNADSVKIYYKPGTFVGSESSSAGWTYLAGDTTQGLGDGLTAQIPVDIAFSALSGNTYAFYLTTVNGNMNYTSGTTVGNILVSNTDLSVLEGNGGGYPFSVTFSPRTFNGKVQYCQTIITSIGQALSEESISVYPNPATTELKIDLPALNGVVANVSIFNVIGKVVLAEQIVANGNSNVLDISNLETGIYFVKVTANGAEYSTKLFVE